MEKSETIKFKQTSNIRQIAATDKENLTAKFMGKKNQINGNSKAYKDVTGKHFKKSNDKGKTELKVRSKTAMNTDSTLATTGLESDLTIDNPSENYWKTLAETRSKALKSALKENLDLHNKVNELEYENERLKAMLDEAKALVEVLTEMIEEKNDDVNGNDENQSALNETEDLNSDSDSC